MDEAFAARLERELDGVDKDDDEADEEDGPDWLFEAGEVRSRDKSYVFCPAEHRKQLLKLFTKHFVQHPLLLDPDQGGRPRTAAEIRHRAVHEMYSFCYARGLTEVWAYMWTSWYSSKMWPLWALSASTRISRLRTTMIVENFWKQLKHDWLHHLLRPRLDHLVWIICSKVVPSYVQRMKKIENAFRSSRGHEATNFQARFKADWKRLRKLPVHRQYRTDVARWICDCGAQKYSAYLLCKHLVKAVPLPSERTWIFLSRRRTIPFYQHPELRPVGQPKLPYVDPDAGCMSDGDDQVWNGDPERLRGGGGWRDMRDGLAASDLHLKRKRSDTPASSVWDDAGSTFDDAASSHTYDPLEVDGLDEDTALEEDQKLRDAMRKRARTLRYVADAIEAQLDKAPHGSANLWLRTTNKMSILDGLDEFAENIRLKESSAQVRRGTWGGSGDKRQKRYAQQTMGYQAGLLE